MSAFDPIQRPAIIFQGVLGGGGVETITCGGFTGLMLQQAYVSIEGSEESPTPLLTIDVNLVTVALVYGESIATSTPILQLAQIPLYPTRPDEITIRNNSEGVPMGVLLCGYEFGAPFD